MPIRELEINNLKKSILEMSIHVEDSIKNAIKAFINRDYDLAGKVIENDNLIDSYDVKIDEECIEFLTLKEPMGKTIRLIITGMKITNNLERIADHAANIAKRTIALKNEVSIRINYADISRMSEVTRGMVRDTINSFINEDARLAKDVIMRDVDVDQRRDYIMKDIIHLMIENPDKISPFMLVNQIPKELERIADQTANIAETVVYMVGGRIIRHSKNF